MNVEQIYPGGGGATEDPAPESGLHGALTAVAAVVALLLLACAPALVIACWRWAL